MNDVGAGSRDRPAEDVPDSARRERWARIKDVLYQALDVEAHERASVLDRECADDPDLRREVLALLAADDAIDSAPQTRSFLDPGVDGIAARMLITGLLAADNEEKNVAVGASQFQAAQAVPFTWGPLEVRALLGSGSFGDVFRAFDPMLQREVALKLRRSSPMAAPGGIQGEQVDAHLEEARRLARVRHPNVLAVHGIETHSGRDGIWTDLVEGETLDRVLERSGPLPREMLTRVGVDLCRALSAVHAAGLVHGDVKAANAMLDVQGRTILMDFGSGDESISGNADSDDIQEETPNASTGAERESPAAKSPVSDSNRRPIQGTPVAMAPELFDGIAASPSSDLYALGILLYRLATGRYPFRGRTVDELLAALRRQHALRLEEARPDLPAAFAHVVHRTLSPSPEGRPSSAEELGRLLSSLATHFDEALDSATRRFVGRRKELATLRSLLASPGWVTMTGPGGGGKTRLTQHIVGEMAPASPGDAIWIDLASCREGDDVVDFIARNLRLREDPRRSRTEQLAERLGEPVELLVLDHLEQVRADVARLRERIVSLCPRLCVLALSRRRLDIPLERVFPLPPLSLPDDRAGSEGLEILDADAPRLFLDRVQRVQQDFVLRAQTAPFVARLTRLLAGNPLAIELIAARVPQHGIQGLESRLNALAAVNERGHENGLRQRTARAIKWAYNQLSPEQSTLFSRLAVFSDGWTLEAAEEICGDEGRIEGQPVLDLLEELVDLSMVVFDEDAPPSGRYRFHESVRRVAARRLGVRSDAYRTHLAHLSWFENAASNRGSELVGTSLPSLPIDPNLRTVTAAVNPAALAFFDADYANLIAALRVGTNGQQGADEADRALCICVAAQRYWEHRGFVREGLRRTEDAIAKSIGPSPAYVRALALVSSFHIAARDFSAATIRAVDAVEAARTIQDQRSSSLALLALASAREASGDLAGARESLEAALGDTGDDSRWRLAVLCHVGNAIARMQDLSAARAAYESALDLARASNDSSSIGQIVGNLADLAWQSGELEEARLFAEESVRTLRRIDPGALWLGLRILAHAAIARRDPEQARTMLVEALSLVDQSRPTGVLLLLLEDAADLAMHSGAAGDAAEMLGYVSAERQRRFVSLAGSAAAKWDSRLHLVRSTLGESAFALAWQRGQAADGARALAVAIGRF